MATVIPITPSPVSAERRDLAHWMSQVLKKLAGVRKSPDVDPVHDLRVALRRCRSLAGVMMEVDAHPAWREMRKAGRKLFRALGKLHDAQVQEGWVKKLAPQGNALGPRLTARLQSKEKRLKERALRRANRFGEKEWRRLSRTLKARMRLVPEGSSQAERLALKRLQTAVELHQRALRTEKSKPWHELRIGVKRFRYAVEMLLPERYQAWEKDLKHIQDLLGDIHDLDVLTDWIRGNEVDGRSPEMRKCEQRIKKERRERVREYRQLTRGKETLWIQWRKKFSGKAAA